jgi:hypothetical protein
MVYSETSSVDEPVNDDDVSTALAESSAGTYWPHGLRAAYHQQPLAVYGPRLAKFWRDRNPVTEWATIPPGTRQPPFGTTSN